ncbi:hypothetical protein BGZ95_005996, partial [Linnemannia exigua]
SREAERSRFLGGTGLGTYLETTMLCNDCMGADTRHHSHGQNHQVRWPQRPL